MLQRAIWLGSRRPFAGAAASIAIKSGYFLSQKNGVSREHPPFWSVPGRRTRCRTLSTRYGSPRTALESSTQPRRRRVSRKMVGRLPHARDAAPRRNRGPRTNERDRTAAYIYNHRRLEQLRQEPAPGSIDWTRRTSATEIRGNLGVQHQFARHLQKHRRAGGHGTDCNWAPQRRPCFPRGLLLVTAPRNSGTPRCAYAQCPRIKRLARRVLCPVEMLLLLFCTVHKPALACIVRENFTRWGRGTYLTLTIAPPGYLRTPTQGASVRPA